MSSAPPRRARPAVLLLAAAGMLSACVDGPAAPTAGPEAGPDAEATVEATVGATVEAVQEPVLAEAGQDTLVLAEPTPADLGLAASQALFERAPVLVVAPSDDGPASARAAAAAVALGMPMLLADEAPVSRPAEGMTAPSGEPSSQTSTAEAPAAGEDALAVEVDRLGVATVLVFGDVAQAMGAVEATGAEIVQAPAGDEQLSDLLGAPLAPAGGPDADPVRTMVGASVGELVPAAEAAAPSGGAGSDATDEASVVPSVEAPAGSQEKTLPPTRATQPAAGLLVMTTGEPDQLAAVATARSAGASMVVVPDGDPRSSGETVQAVAAAEPDRTIGLGAAFGDAETLGWRTQSAATGVELPGGGQLVLPGKTYVALYGSPITASLGVLGEQGPEATVQRARTTAEPYEELTDDTVVPTLEIIATVASGSAGRDGNYSNEWSPDELRPLVERAGEAGQYVVLDLQPGRTDFLTQAKQYEDLLRLPHVGLALDPEWRLGPDEVHLRQIGQVDVAEVDEVVTWLADLTRSEQLPQKLLVLHQFQARMIPGVDTVDQSRSELEVLVHVDGQGSQPAKQDTWRVLQANAESIDAWGWKNFHDEDSPMLTPEQTMQVEPQPDFISYQ